MGKNKPIRNAFYFFVQEYKSKQPQRFDTYNEFFQAAGPLWSQMSPEERRPYEERSKREKKDQKVVKYTTSGIDITVVERKEQEKVAKKQKMTEHIDNMLEVLHSTGALADEYFYIVHVNYFCRYTDNLRYVPAELAVARFTLRDGVTSENVYHIIVEPGQLQVGYSSIVKETSETTHKLPPPVSYESQKNNLETVLSGLKAFMREMHPTGELPPIYAEDKNLHVVENVLENLIYDYGSAHETFSLKVYALDYFFFALRNQVGNGVWPQASISTLELEKDVYDFCVDITCSFHELSDAPNYCSKSHVMRKAYIILDQCCGDLNIELIPGKHVPRKSKVQSSRPPSRASSVASSYVTARSVARQSTVKEEDYLSTNDSMFSETSTLVDVDEFPPIMANMSCNESAHTDEENWEQPKQRYKNRKTPEPSQFQRDSSQESVQSQPAENRSRRPVTFSAAFAGMSVSGSGATGIRSMVGRGRGRGFSDKM